MEIKTGHDLAAACREVAENYKTLYVMGCFGAPLNDGNKKRYTNNHAYNRQPWRKKMIEAATADTFGFDCVCLIKGLLWGWDGDENAAYGGAKYCANGVPDIGTGQMINLCADVSTDFSSLSVGEAVWMPGHIGVYIGGGLAVECTPKWDNCVQITACNRDVAGYHRRDWVKHGKLPYITYEQKESEKIKEESDMSLPMLKKGDRGSAVRVMQALLISEGYDLAGYGADGEFGGVTDKALRDYQKTRGIDPDGICGPITWKHLLGIG